MTFKEGLTFEAEGMLVDYHIEKSKQPMDWHARQVMAISGWGDYSESDAGQPLEEKNA